MERAYTSDAESRISAARVAVCPLARSYTQAARPGTQPGPAGRRARGYSAALTPCGAAEERVRRRAAHMPRRAGSADARAGGGRPP